MFGMLEY